MNTKWPLSLVVVLLSSRVTVLLSVTVTPATAAFEGSVTVPFTSPLELCAARESADDRTQRNRIAAPSARALTSMDFMIPPKRPGPISGGSPQGPLDL